MVKTHPVKVIIRTRPTEDFASKNISINQSSGEINLQVAKSESGGFINNQNDSWSFKFDHILHNCTQETVFESVMEGQHNLTSIFDGYNVSFMTYGQTGAGKTYTMMGGTLNYKYRGLIPRSLDQVFNEIDRRQGISVKVSCSYLEIQNEVIFDLLSDTNQELTIQDDVNRGVIVKGLTTKPCESMEDGLNCVFEGESYRTIGEHALNKNSSRSHCVFTVQLEIRSTVESSEKVVHSKLHLIDLAGSERTKKTHSEGIVLKEASYINKSLSFLEQVVTSLSDGRDYIPYRQSKLTNILKDSIGGNAFTAMFANLWPEATHVDETCSTLRFASRMAKIENKVTINIQQDSLLYVKILQKELKELKQELSLHDSLVNKDSGVEPFTSEKRQELKEKAIDYFEGKTSELDFDSVRMISEYFMIFKEIFKTQTFKKEEPEIIKPQDENGSQPGAEEAEDGEMKKMGESFYKPPDKQSAYQEQKDLRGKEIITQIEDTRQVLKEKNDLLKELAEETQDIKSTISAMTNELKTLKAKDEEKDMIEGEQFEKTKELSAKKELQKEKVEMMKSTKEEQSTIKKTLETTKNLLVTDFEKQQDEQFDSLNQPMSNTRNVENNQPAEAEDASFFNAIHKAERLRKKASLHNKRK